MGDPSYEGLNQIRQTGDQLTQVARTLRTLYEQMRDLRTKLYSAYNVAIGETSQRIERLPKTAENTAELNRLTETLREYVDTMPEGQEAIYYIGETQISNRETLVFDISVLPEGETDAAQLRFKRDFYTDS